MIPSWPGVIDENGLPQIAKDRKADFLTFCESLGIGVEVTITIAPVETGDQATEAQRRWFFAKCTEINAHHRGPGYDRDELDLFRKQVFQHYDPELTSWTQLTRARARDFLDWFVRFVAKEYGIALESKELPK